MLVPGPLQGGAHTNVYILSYTEIKPNTVGFGGGWGWGLPGIKKKKVKSQGRP